MQRQHQGFYCEARSKVGEKGHSTALMLVRPWLPLGREDPRPSQRLLKPHRTCWGRARGSFVSTRQEVEGKGTKCEDEWCHFPHGLPKDRSHLGRSPRVDTLRVAQSAPGEPQRRANLHPISPGPGTMSQPRGLTDAERGSGGSVSGHGAWIREPGCRHSGSEGSTHRTAGLSWVVRAAVKT